VLAPSLLSIWLPLLGTSPTPPMKPPEELSRVPAKVRDEATVVVAGTFETGPLRAPSERHAPMGPPSRIQHHVPLQGRGSRGLRRHRPRGLHETERGRRAAGIRRLLPPSLEAHRKEPRGASNRPGEPVSRQRPRALRGPCHRQDLRHLRHHQARLALRAYRVHFRTLSSQDRTRATTSALAQFVLPQRLRALDAVASRLY
jgi:hypothetical protein